MFESAEYRTPGQLIKDLLKERGWSQSTLGIVLDMNETAVSHLIAGRRDITPKIAIQLGRVFQVPSWRFLQLQLVKEEALTPDDPGLAKRGALFGALPISDMIARGWIRAPSAKDTKTVEAELVRFFGAASADEIEILPHAAKRTEVSTDATPAQRAWLYRVKKIADEILVPAYSPEALRAALPKLRRLAMAPEEARHVPRIMEECGVRFAIVEQIGNAKIDGVCFWLRNNTSPVIALSMRFDRIDNFWFVLRHEIEHVLRGHGRSATVLDTDLDGERGGVGSSVSQEEREANEAAAEFCVPQKDLRQFIAHKSPTFPERDMLGFARTIGVHPGLVAGQIRRATGRYDLFSKHVVKIRSAIAPTATIDGWGDVLPVDG